MKKLVFTIIASLFLMGANPLLGQADVENAIATALSAYESGNLDDTRFKLQQALEEIDKTIALKILELLPEQMGDMAASGDDEYTGNVTGFTGLYVNRSYSNSANPEQRVEVTLLNDSPLMAGVNAFLNAPIIGGLTGMGRKRIRVDGYKGSLQQDENDPASYDVNIPFGQSLFTVRFEGIGDENKVLAMVNTIPVAQIAKVAQ